MEFDDGISRMKKGTSKTTLALVVVVTCVVVTAITVPLTYFLHPDKTSPGSSDSQKGDCPTVAPTSGPSQPPVMVEDHERVNCFPGWDDYSEEECLKRGCIYSEPAMDKDAPICYFPSDYGGYRMVGKEEVTLSGLRVTLDRIASTPSLFGGDIERLLLDVEFHSEYRLRIKVIRFLLLHALLPCHMGAMYRGNQFQTISTQKCLSHFCEYAASRSCILCCQSVF